MGIVEARAPALFADSPQLTIEHSGGKDSYAVSGGLLQITPEKVTVLGEIIEKIDGDHEAAILRGKELVEDLTEQDS